MPQQVHSFLEHMPSSFLPAATLKPSLKLQPPHGRSLTERRRAWLRRGLRHPVRFPRRAYVSRRFPQEDALAALPASATRAKQFLSNRPCATRFPDRRPTFPSGEAAPPTTAATQGRPAGTTPRSASGHGHAAGPAAPSKP